MLSKQEIVIMCHRDGESQRSIARTLQMSRKTVKRYLEIFYEILERSDDATTAIAEYLSKTIRYNSDNRHKVRLTELTCKRIDHYLKLNNERRNSGLIKQLLKKCDIHEALRKEGIEISYASVCNYIQKKENKLSAKEAFIRQDPEAGDSIEFDWGEIKLNIGGKQTRLYLAVFTNCYSNYRYALIYNRQDTLAFQESHVSFFSHLGCVPREMVYDNMRVAVKKFVGVYEKEPTEALLAMRSHYQFTHRFCNIRRGNEKGHVERSVEYVRRKAFALEGKFDNLDKARVHLQKILDETNLKKQQLTGQSAYERLQIERKSMLHAHSPMVCYETAQLRVDKYSTICCRTNRYSVKDNLVGKFVDIKIYSDKIECYHENELVGKHERCYEKHQWIIDIKHFMKTLMRKPGALPGSVALQSNSILKELYTSYFISRPRDFMETLHYCKENNITDNRLKDIVVKAQKSGAKTVTMETVVALLGNDQTPCIATKLPDDEINKISRSQLQQTNNLFINQSSTCHAN